MPAFAKHNLSSAAPPTAESICLDFNSVNICLPPPTPQSGGRRDDLTFDPAPKHKNTCCLKTKIKKYREHLALLVKEPVTSWRGHPPPQCVLFAGEKKDISPRSLQLLATSQLVYSTPAVQGAFFGYNNTPLRNFVLILPPLNASAWQTKSPFMRTWRGINFVCVSVFVADWRSLISFTCEVSAGTWRCKLGS